MSLYCCQRVGDVERGSRQKEAGRGEPTMEMPDSDYDGNNTRTQLIVVLTVSAQTTENTIKSSFQSGKSLNGQRTVFICIKLCALNRLCVFVRVRAPQQARVCFPVSICAYVYVREVSQRVRQRGFYDAPARGRTIHEVVALQPCASPLG